MTLKDFQKSLAVLNNQVQYGCGNHGCRINPPKGMATNSSCNCCPNSLARILTNLAAELKGKYSWDQP